MTFPLAEDSFSNPNSEEISQPKSGAVGALQSMLNEIIRVVTKPSPDEVQYYVPPGSCNEAQALLEREDLSEQDVLDFVQGRKLRGLPEVEGNEMKQHLLDAYHKRRREILELGKKLWKDPPEAYIDEDGRLMPVTDDDENNMLGELPPLPDRHGNNNNDNDNHFGRGNNHDNGNDAGINNIPLGNNHNNNIPFPLDQEEEERRWLEQEEREAELAIARAVQRYQKQGVPEEEYVLLKVPLAERPERASLTFRRICFAVLAVVTAFVCIMLQTLPLFPFDSRPDPVFDKLLYELAEVRHFPEHARACPGLHRSPLPPQPWTSRLKFWESREQVLDCSDGVLHIPAKSVLIGAFYESSTDREASFWKSYVTGVNVSWFLPCNPPKARCQANFPELSCQAPQDPTGDRSIEEPLNARCFRGIHDNIITDLEIADALRMGADLIQDGGDHFDIHDNVFILQDRLPTLVNSIERLLRDAYMVQGKIRPVAFRVNAVGPFDGSGVALRGANSQTSSLLRLFNRQNYVRWIEKYARHNELARYSIPWPSRPKPFRDPCKLMADIEADPRFNIHTSVFLSNGAGREFRGGVSLYVDDHPSNSNPRRKIQRGVTVDGTRGRLVVSTGGLENRRCRLPTREGVRAALQIWWSCDTQDDGGSA